MNGALAIADVLGIYGRYGVDLAAYWRHPPVGSPGWFAFKMHGNYDEGGLASTAGGAGGGWKGSRRRRTSARSPHTTTSTNMLRLMLINKRPDSPIDLALDIRSLDAGLGRGASSASARTTSTAITEQEMCNSAMILSIVLPPYSITLVEVPAAT